MYYTHTHTYINTYRHTWLIMRGISQLLDPDTRRAVRRSFSVSTVYSARSCVWGLGLRFRI
jgi:hypothetical protein